MHLWYCLILGATCYWTSRRSRSEFPWEQEDSADLNLTLYKRKAGAKKIDISWKKGRLSLNTLVHRDVGFPLPGFHLSCSRTWCNFCWGWGGTSLKWAAIPTVKPTSPTLGQEMRTWMVSFRQRERKNPFFPCSFMSVFLDLMYNSVATGTYIL